MKFEIALEQVWYGDAGGDNITVEALDDKRVCGRSHDDEGIGLFTREDLLENYKLAKHQSGADIDEDTYEYREFNERDDSNGWEQFKEYQQSWYRSLGVACGDSLYRRKKPAEPELEIGALYISPNGKVLRRIDSNTKHSIIDSDARGTSVCWSENFNRSDCRWTMLEKVTRDDPRVVAILGPVEPELPYVDCGVYKGHKRLSFTNPEGYSQPLNRAVNDARFVGYVYSESEGETTMVYNFTRLVTDGRNPAQIPSHVRFAR